MHSYKTYSEVTSFMNRRPVVLNVGKVLQSLATLKNYTNILIHVSLWVLYKILMYYIYLTQGGIPGYLYWLITGFATISEAFDLLCILLLSDSEVSGEEKTGRFCTTQSGYYTGCTFSCSFIWHVGSGNHCSTYWL